jgi:hypothetical protein
LVSPMTCSDQALGRPQLLGSDTMTRLERLLYLVLIIYAIFSIALMIKAYKVLSLVKPDKVVRLEVINQQK